VAIVSVLLGGGSLAQQIKTLCAVVPGLFILERLVRRDRFPEPAGLVLLAFVCGAAACLPAALAEAMVARLTRGLWVESSLPWLGSDLTTAFLQAGVCEETLKYLVLTALCMRWKAFDEPIDGMVYGIAVSLGFATLENVTYVLGQHTWAAAMQVARARAVTALPAHAALGAVMGFFVGLSRVRQSNRLVLLAVAWAAPVALHGAYDFLLFANRRTRGALGLLWIWLLVYQLRLAWRMLRKLQAVQGGAPAEALVQRVLQRLGLSPGNTA